MVVGQVPEQRPTGLLVIVPRDQAESCASLAAEFEVMPGCRVIVDRRLGEQRRVPSTWESDERRRGERRSSTLEYSHGCGGSGILHLASVDLRFL